MYDDTLKILFAEYINAHPGGGSLHIAYEDNNISDGDIASCYRYAEKECDIAGMVIAGFLMRMSESERNEFFSLQVYDLAGKFESDVIIEEAISNAMAR